MKQEKVRVLATIKTAREPVTTEFVCNRAMLKDYIKYCQNNIMYIFAIIEETEKSAMWHWDRKTGWQSMGFIE